MICVSLPKRRSRSFSSERRTGSSEEMRKMIGCHDGEAERARSD
jgi:hypothetical protein